jgi:peptide/nickel transport system substrate-binding protein
MSSLGNGVQIRRTAHLGLVAAIAAMVTSVVGANAQLAAVPRSDTFIAATESSGNSPTFTQHNDFNPFRPTGDRRSSITHVLEGLFYYSALSDKTIPWLATGYSYNPDYTSITIDLREGVTWSDGKLFTADDVIYTLEMLKENGKGKADSLFAADMARDIKDIERLSDHKLRINLTRPDPRWAFTFLVVRFNRQGVHVVPKHIYSTFPPSELQAFTGLDPSKQGWPVGTGAFRVAEMKPERLVFDRRDDWWGAKTGFRPAPAMQRVIFVPFTTHEAAAQLIANNEVDTILEAQVPVMKSLIARNPKITTSSGRVEPFGNIDWWPTSLIFNHDDPQWKDVRIRRAVSLFLNRKQLIDFAYQGAAAVSILPYPAYPALQPFIKDIEPEVKRLRTADFDVKAAEGLMLEAGAKKDGQGFWTLDGKRLGGDLFFTPSLNAIAPVIAEQLRRAGFEVAASSRPGHRDVIYSGKAAWFVWGHGGSVNDPFQTMRLYHKRWYRPVGEIPLWPSRWQNDQFSALVDEIERIPPTDPKVRELVKRAWTIWLEQQVAAPISEFYHRIPLNTTYWTNWPSQADPYIPPTFWADTGYLLLLGVKKAAP